MSGIGNKNKQGIGRVIQATICTIAGLRAAWQHEAAFRLELCIVLLLFPLALWVGKTGLERALLTGTLLLILVVELLNSAIEAVVDRIGAELHELSGRAKDLGSAAVGCALALAFWVWISVLFFK